MTKTLSKEMDSHSYINVHDENPYTRKWMVNHTNMYMTKTHSKVMDSHFYRNVHDENPYTIIWIVIRTNMYMTKPIQKKLIVIRTEMYMTKAYSKEIYSHSYKHVPDENPCKRNG